MISVEAWNALQCTSIPLYFVLSFFLLFFSLSCTFHSFLITRFAMANRFQHFWCMHIAKKIKNMGGNNPIKVYRWDRTTLEISSRTYIYICIYIHTFVTVLSLSLVNYRRWALFSSSHLTLFKRFFTNILYFPKEYLLEMIIFSLVIHFLFAFHIREFNKQV